eukprot:m.908512 g.908512  ORF g.908512 m.908512 type:complete len:492 (+) comp23714_c0_seq5:444-1919(+)
MLLLKIQWWRKLNWMLLRTQQRKEKRMMFKKNLYRRAHPPTPKMSTRKSSIWNPAWKSSMGATEMVDLQCQIDRINICLYINGSLPFLVNVMIMIVPDFDPYKEDYGDNTPEDFDKKVDAWADMVDVYFPTPEDEADPERVEREREKEEYIRYLESEKQRMMEDEEYRKNLIEEFEEIHSQGEDIGSEDKGLYELAKRLERAQIRHGRLRTSLDERTERNLRKLRERKRMEREKEFGVGTKEDLGRIHDEHVEPERHKADQKRRRLAFLQREADQVLRFRKKIHEEQDPEKRKELVQLHEAYNDKLRQKTGAQPGHANQLKEIWDKEDGLVGIQFNPRTFFRLHDVNDDNVFDAKEIEAMMMHEARNLHEIDGFVDERAVSEEATRMQESMMNDYDYNRNGLIEYHEFLDFAEGEGFVVDAKWHALNPDQELAHKLQHQTLHETNLETLRRFREHPSTWDANQPGQKKDSDGADPNAVEGGHLKEEEERHH